MRFEGIIIPVVTPFHADYSVDEASYAAMIELLLDRGASAIVIGGTTGENYALTREERLRQFEFAHEVIAGRVPWIAGVNDIRTEDVCMYAAAARDHGAGSILCRPGQDSSWSRACQRTD